MTTSDFFVFLIVNILIFGSIFSTWAVVEHFEVKEPKKRILVMIPSMIIVLLTIIGMEIYSISKRNTIEYQWSIIRVTIERELFFTPIQHIIVLLAIGILSFILLVSFYPKRRKK